MRPIVTNGVLDDIVAARRAQVERSKAAVPLDQMREAADRRARSGDTRDFAAALSDDGLSVIAELKKASPSRGLLCRDYRPREIALGYEKGGAAALSVLTEEQFFLGSLEHLKGVRESVRLPVLRKDFIVDAYQVYESVAAGADALLLIVAALTDETLAALVELANNLGIAELVEVHNEEETRRAVAAGARIIGVNNRDLRTFDVKLETSFRLRAMIPPGCLAISESGIGTSEDLDRLRQAGFDAVLIGERLITQADPGLALAELMKGRSQESGNRSQESEVRSKRSGDRSQKSEAGSQESEVRS